MKSRWLTLIMFTAVIMCLAACDKVDNEIKKTDDRYSAERILPNDFGFSLGYSFEDGLYIYLDGACIDDPEVSTIWRYDTEKNELSKTSYHRDRSKFPGENIKMCFMDSGYIGDDGSYSILTMSFQEVKDEKHDFFKYTYDSEGELFQVTDLTEALRGFFDGTMVEYPMNVIVLSEEVLFTYSEDPLISDLVLMSESGKVIFDTKLDGYVLDIQVREDGRILVLEKDYFNNFVNLLEINRQTGKKKELVKQIKNTDTCRFASGNDPDKIFFLTDEGLLQCDHSGREICEIFRLSDINVAKALDVKAILQVSDGSWHALIDTGEKTDKEYFYNYNFFKIQKTDKVMRELTLALTNAEPLQISECRDAAVLFNKAQDAVRVVVKNYESVDELAKEILAGKIPDLIDISDASIRGSLEKKGLLEDLHGFLTRDTELSKVDFLDKALEIYEKNGALWAIPEKVSMMALIGNEDYLADREGWTFNEFKDFISDLPEPVASRKYLVRSDFLQYVCPVLLPHFVDFSAGNCNFETEEFYEILEFIKNCSDNKYGEMDFERFYDEVRSGEFRMIMAGITGIQDYELLISMYSRNGKIIGFPSDDRNGVYVVPEGCAIAITTKCQEKEAAWGFVKYFLTGEEHASGAIPSYVPNYKSMIQEAYDETENHKPQMQIAYGNIYLDIPYAGKEDIEAFEKLLYNGYAAKVGDKTIVQIIQEEAESFFKGQDTVRQVAERIQNRVQLYLNE